MTESSPLHPLHGNQNKTSITNEKREFEVDSHARDMADRDVNREQRYVFASRLFKLVCRCAMALFALLLFQMFAGPFIPAYRPLSDSVIIALISSMVSLIGILKIALKYVFQTPDDKR